MDDKTWFRLPGQRWLAGLAPRQAAWLVAGTLLLAAVLLTLLLVAPGKAVSTQITSDYWFMLDGADRLLKGQVPNRDFHTPLGPLVYGLLALGYAIGGDIGGMLPFATGLFVVALAPLAIYACVSRLPPAFALAFGLYILILVIAPAFIGDISPKPTYAMFYNRFGWALLSLTFLFVLPRRTGVGMPLLDIAAMTLLWLLTFYIKITFAAVAAALILGLLWFPHARRSALITIAAAAISVLVIHLLWGGTGTYIADISAAANATGTLRGGVLGLFASVVNNFKDAYLFAAILLLALISRGRYDYLLFCLFIAGAGIVLDRHNSQGPGILTFIPAAMVALLAPRRKGEAAGTPGLAATLIFGALLIPVAFVSFSNLAFHFVAAVRDGSAEQGTPLDGLVVMDAPSSTRQEASAVSGCGPVDGGQILLDSDRGQQPLGQSQFVALVRDGSALIAGDPRLAGKIMALDTINPFTAMLGRMPPPGGDSFVDADITISEAVHRPPQAMFAEVDVVMVPKFPLKDSTFDLLRKLYRPYLDGNFALTARSPCWDAYRRVAGAASLAKSPAQR